MSSDTVRPKRRTVGDSGEGSAPRSRSAVSFVQLSQLVRSEGKRRYQRVLLLNPAATLFHADLPRCTYPLGIGYIAAVLERHGYEVKILDVFAAGYDRGLPLEEDSSFIRYGSPLEEVEALLRDFHPDVVGVSNIFSNQADNVHELLQLAKRTLPDVVTAVGGAHARYFPKACLEDPALDAVFLGESEFTFLRWLQHLNGAVDASELRGIAFRQDDKVTILPESPLISSRPNDANGLGARGVVFEGELDGIPFPAWHLYDMERYLALRGSW